MEKFDILITADAAASPAKAGGARLGNCPGLGGVQCELRLG